MPEQIDIDHDIIDRGVPTLSTEERIEQLEDRVNDLEDMIESLTRRRDERSFIPEERFD